MLKGVAEGRGKKIKNQSVGGYRNHKGQENSS